MAHQGAAGGVGNERMCDLEIWISVIGLLAACEFDSKREVYNRVER